MYVYKLLNYYFVVIYSDFAIQFMLNRSIQIKQSKQCVHTQIFSGLIRLE